MSELLRAICGRQGCLGHGALPRVPVTDRIVNPRRFVVRQRLSVLFEFFEEPSLPSEALLVDAPRSTVMPSWRSCWRVRVRRGIIKPRWFPGSVVSLPTATSPVGVDQYREEQGCRRAWSCRSGRSGLLGWCNYRPGRRWSSVGGDTDYAKNTSSGRKAAMNTVVTIVVKRALAVVG